MNLNKQYQEMMNMNTNYQDVMDEKSPEDTKKVAFSKRTTAKFRSMDFTSQSLGRINSKISSEGINSKHLYQDHNNINKEWGKQHQDVLADLKEASLEGGNSISLSPQRTMIPDLTPNPGNKIQTLKKSRI
jgi:hypothetical protein